MHEEGIDAAMDDIDKKGQAHQGKLAIIKPLRIWNADEAGLFFCMSPDRTLLSEPVQGTKKEKGVVSVVCANADGWPKMPF